MYDIEDYEERRRIQNLIAQRKWRERARNKQKMNSQIHTTPKSATREIADRSQQSVLIPGATNFSTDLYLYHKPVDACSPASTTNFTMASHISEAQGITEASNTSTAQPKPIGPILPVAGPSSIGSSVESQPGFCFQLEGHAGEKTLGHTAQVIPGVNNCPTLSGNVPYYISDFCMSFAMNSNDIVVFLLLSPALIGLEQKISGDAGKIPSQKASETDFQIKIIEALDTAAQLYDCGSTLGLFPCNGIFLRQLEDAKLCLLSLPTSFLLDS